MKAIGIVRKTDPLGRVTIPKELRDMLKIKKGTPLEIFLDNENVILKKYEPGDIFTGDMKNIIEYCGKNVSRQSIIEMARLTKLTECEIYANT